MEIIGAGILILLIFAGCFLVFLFINTFLLWLTAGWANIEDKSFGKAFLSTLCGMIGVFVVGGILGFIPFLGFMLSILASFFIPVIITQAIFGTTFTKALIAELIRLLIIICFSLLLGLLSLLFVGFEAIQGFFSQSIQQLTSSFQTFIG